MLRNNNYRFKDFPERNVIAILKDIIYNGCNVKAEFEIKPSRQSNYVLCTDVIYFDTIDRKTSLQVQSYNKAKQTIFAGWEDDLSEV